MTIFGIMNKDKQYIISEEELEKLLKHAYFHGQGNGQMMECGLERDEISDYLQSMMYGIKKDSIDEDSLIDHSIKRVKFLK